ncbi:MAG: DegV family protein [Oscillospiraceae bacterium]|nr:DegV family protein [Oscillospiraceae bacterium]
MSKVRIMTDSASDVSVEQAAKYGISLVNFWIVVGDKTFKENEEYTTEEFYKIMEESEEMPHTSQITVMDYSEAYEKEYNDGVTDLINVVIASIGSNSYNNACMAKDEFYEKHPEAVGQFNITVIDSKAYTGAYGLPVMEAAKKVQKGAEADEVIAFLKEWFDCGIIVCTAYTLKYARKSGRVGCATAFVGDLLGLKPIITFVDAVSNTAAKVRGEKAVIPQLVDYAVSHMVPQTPYSILDGSRPECTEEVIKLMKKAVGYGPTEIHKIGATIACHLGHQVSGVIIKGPNRNA